MESMTWQEGQIRWDYNFLKALIGSNGVTAGDFISSYFKHNGITNTSIVINSLFLTPHIEEYANALEESGVMVDHIYAMQQPHGSLMIGNKAIHLKPYTELSELGSDALVIAYMFTKPSNYISLAGLNCSAKIIDSMELFLATASYYKNQGVLQTALRVALQSALRVQAKCVFVNYHRLEHIANPTEHVAHILRNAINAYDILNSPLSHRDHINPPFLQQNYNDDFVLSTVGYNGKDYNSNQRDNPYVTLNNIDSRVVSNQPDVYENKIYIFGNSLVFGQGCDDDNTIGSVLQSRLNNDNAKFRVECYYRDQKHLGLYITHKIDSLQLMKNDILVFCTYFTDMSKCEYFNLLEHYKSNGLMICDFQDIFDDYYDEVGEVFYDAAGHMNPIGYQRCGNHLYDFIKSSGMIGGHDETLHEKQAYVLRNCIDDRSPSALAFANNVGAVDKELAKYIQYIKYSKIPIGSIVMNCNPFTLGHKYLIEYAATRVEKLYVFCVEEDASFFPFEDRLNLITQGVKELTNVVVLRSGQYIISKTTFGVYFQKEEKQDITIDPTKDLLVFARHIAPALGINVRFAGEEPFDNITRQYNDAMRKILPINGIEFCEIPRMSMDGDVISASKVRKLLASQDFDGIKTIVPQTTLEYLMKYTGACNESS